MVVSIELNDEEKSQVLLIALALFLAALLVSLCLAFAFCPLHKWLTKRDAKRQAKRHKNTAAPTLARAPQRADQFHRNIIFRYQQQHYYRNKSAPTCNGTQSYMGPPPAYEAALKATRLQSLTGNCLGVGPLHEASLAASGRQDKSSPDWLGTALTNNVACYNQDDDEPQLDLGDYFHQPREFLQPPSALNGNNLHDEHVLIPMHSTASCRQSAAESHHRAGRPTPPEPPVMLRLWVKLMEPGELVERARAQTPAARLRRQQEVELQREQQLSSQGSMRRLSMTRQLSIPQLFGSLMTTLASSKSSTEICGESKQQTLATGSGEPKGSQMQELRVAPGSDERQLSSLSSDTNSTENYSSSTNEEEQQGSSKRNNSNQTDPATGTSGISGTSGKSSSSSSDSGRLKAVQQQQQQQTRRRHSTSPASSITSRVLHMNVASFSYVKDENFISTKKHNQLNFQHFYTGQTKSKLDANGRDSRKSGGGKAKMCQLLVSICDVENLLSSSLMRSKACMRLTQNSSIYVKCEIVVPKLGNLSTTATRLLRCNPLKVLTHQQSSSSGSLTGSSQHATVHFASTLPATAIEPTPTIQLQDTTSAAVNCVEGPRGASCAAELTDCDGGERMSGPDFGHQNCLPIGVNWRHEPSADGKSIVVFNSIPKQIAQQQQLAYSITGEQQHHHHLQQADGQCVPPSDLVQFDSVFVSPILAKSTLADGHIRLRVYTQCKYVNETCVAELKLPLKQLLRTQTGDNLGDIMGPSRRAADSTKDQADQTKSHEQDKNGSGLPVIDSHQQRQADVILDNLLANLVTASTGSPLGALVEQISSEAREEEEEAHKEHPSELSAHKLASNSSSSFRLSSWLPTTGAGNSSGSGDNNNNNCDNAKIGASLQRASCSLGAALNHLDPRQQLEEHQEHKFECHDPDRDPCGGGGVDMDNYWQQASSECDKLIERNYCRSLMVSHWLNHLVAPSYECQPVEESRGKLVLGLTYLPTSNRIIFNALRASVEPDACRLASDKQLIKRLRLHSDTSYLLRFMMVANNRVLKRKQTACSRKPEWDSQGAVTFDLVSVSVEQPKFIVALVMRNSRAIAHATGSLQSLSSNTNYCHLSKVHGSGGGDNGDGDGDQQEPLGAAVRSDSELLRHNAYGSDLYRSGAQLGGNRHRGKRDLVVGHLVLDDDIWHELRAQPRRQIIRQFKLI